MHPFEIVRGSNDFPLSSNLLNTAQRELLEAKDVFNYAEDWLDCALAFAINLATSTRTQTMSRSVNERRIWLKRCRFLKALQTARVPLAPIRNVRHDRGFGAQSQIGRAIISGVGKHFSNDADLWIEFA